jgi:hypothetical protein
MRYLVSLAVTAALLLGAATPADAITGFRRTITTSCLTGKINAYNQHTGSNYRTPQPCTEAVWVPEKQTYSYIYRPWTDFKGADLAAERWYPGCYRQLDEVSGPVGGAYDMVYSFICS